jgi:hypothetical protein
MSMLPFTGFQRGFPVPSRNITRIAALFLLFAYLPIFVGGGECVALCMSAEDGLKLDYSHTCGKTHSEAAHHTSNGKHAALTGWHSHDSHSDIPLFSGSASLTVPAISHDAAPAADCACDRAVSPSSFRDVPDAFAPLPRIKIPPVSPISALSAVRII